MVTKTDIIKQFVTLVCILHCTLTQAPHIINMFTRFQIGKISASSLTICRVIEYGYAETPSGYRLAQQLIADRFCGG